MSTTASGDDTDQHGPTDLKISSGCGRAGGEQCDGLTLMVAIDGGYEWWFMYGLVDAG